MMFSRRELKRVYGLTVGLLVLAVASYAAFPGKPLKQPIRIAFPSVAGKVMFDHSRHLSEAGYALACQSRWRSSRPCSPLTWPMPSRL